MSITAPKKLSSGNCPGKRIGPGVLVALCFSSLPPAAWAADTLPAENPAAPVAVRPVSGTNQPETLRLNFRDVPLGQVLEYFSEAAGFVVVTETPVTGNVTVTGAAPLSLAAAVDWLTAELNRHNDALIRSGRMLTIVARNEARTRSLPVKTGSNPELIANNAELATWIIPLRFVAAGDLLKVLSPFVSAQATVTANEAANVLVVTDTQSNIRHLARIIQAVDNSAEAEQEIRVFRLKHANPAEVASELNIAFGNDTSSGNNPALPLNVAGDDSSFPGPPGEANATTTSQPDRVKAALQVTAVADARLQAVIVGAPNDLMRQIASLMDSLDVPSTRDQKVFVYHLNNGDPNQVMAELQGLFQSSDASGSTSSSAQTSALQQRATKNATTTSSSTTTGAGGGTGGGTTGDGAGSP